MTSKSRRSKSGLTAVTLFPESPMSQLTTSEDDLQPHQSFLEQQLLDAQSKITETESRSEESQELIQRLKNQLGVSRNIRSKLEKENTELIDRNAKLESNGKSLDSKYSNLYNIYLKLFQSNATLEEEHTSFKNKCSDGELYSISASTGTGNDYECKLPNTTCRSKTEMQMQIKRLEEEVRDQENKRVEVLRGINESLSTEWQVLYDLYIKVQAEQVELTESSAVLQQEQDRLNAELKREQSDRKHFEHCFVCCEEELHKIHDSYQEQIDDLNGKLEAAESDAQDFKHDLDSMRETIQETEGRMTMMYDKKLESLKLDRDSFYRLYNREVEESKSKDDMIAQYVSKWYESESQMQQIIQERDDAICRTEAAEECLQYGKDVDDEIHQLLLHAVDRNGSKKRKYDCGT